MNNDIVVFWFVVLVCLVGLRVALRQIRTGTRGWVVLLSLILAVDVAGWFRERAALIYTAGGMWLVLVLLPGLLSKLYHRRMLQQRYADARRVAMIIRWLHPADGWREQDEFVRAAELAQQGEFAAASETLKRYEGADSLVSLAAMPTLYRITNEWENFIVWEARHRHQVERIPGLLPSSLRARGETGDVLGLVELYDQRKAEIRRLAPLAVRDLCRLMLFAFCGKRKVVERLFTTNLAVLPAATQSYWLAVADLAAGEREAARSAFEQLLPEADPPTRRAIERNLSRMSTTPEPLGADAAKVVESAALEVEHDERFGGQPTLFSKQARATQLLILLNVLMFGAEIVAGGTYNPEALFRLGALYSPAVRAGEWWRLATALFLHLGPLHLAMNMVGLWVLGPFIELALGAGRFLFAYLLCGIGSMFFVMTLASGAGGDELTVGASGSVMSLVGATGALMLRGWLREKAISAKRRLVAVVVIIVMQTVFDALVPHVSMSGHLSGAALGFLAATCCFPPAHRVVLGFRMSRLTHRH